jgi:haloalkane dehalogenase
MCDLFARPDRRDAGRLRVGTANARRTRSRKAIMLSSPLVREPADVVDVFERYGVWLAESATTPKLVLTFGTPSVLGSAEVIDWLNTHVACLEVRDLGRAGHHAPEDRPHDIGRAIAAWLVRHGLVTAP